ncbi:MAG: hypothetical protein QOH32_3635 [Bradyrhizobium sp.]|jgi:hypothetical protein|nr:hypothetical protein [Bradyrhizobium sp.]
MGRGTLLIMTDRNGNMIAMRRLVAVAVLLTIPAASGWPQAATRPTPSAQGVPAPATPPPQEQPAPPSEPARKENPGLLNEIGKMLEHPTSMLPTFRSPKETLDDAADALSRLAKSPGVKGRVICPVAPNGAPDCKAAADKLCHGNGFREGKSLDVDTTRNCSAKSWLSGRKPDESECRTETWVTRAVCQ